MILFIQCPFKENKNMIDAIKNKINSATVLVLALCIIAIFFLAVTYLKSVIFGLILACFCLPVQDWIKRKIIKSRFFLFISKVIHIIFLPVTYPFSIIKLLLYNRKGEKTLTKKDKELKHINLSCTTTVFSVILFLLLVLSTISWISTSCFSSLTNSVSSWVNKTTDEYHSRIVTDSGFKEKNIALPKNNKKNAVGSAQESQEGFNLRELVNAILYKLDSVRPAIEESQTFQVIKKYLTSSIRESEDAGGLPAFFLKKSGGIFSFTTGALGSIFSFLMNLVFTFFFFAFFLSQMAKLAHRINDRLTTGQYIVRGIVYSGWFPNIKKETIKGAVTIIDDILSKLKAWIRGYLSIIIIETIFYVTTFLLAGVPYAVGVGIIAGLTILLPYIGPVLSFLLTISVCLVFGPGSIIQILIILSLYIFMNGACEQLFLYPSIVGGALGLNEFETIIVVLLGGILAGITGLIFAVPVAAVIKYLIPKAYSIINEQEINS
ncbi:MAG: AI-2E family transporter [Victivallales bacterium]|nr:AI-2E family transporter [Victivallales bacterium]